MLMHVPKDATSKATDLRPLLRREAAPFGGLSSEESAGLLEEASRHGLLAAVAGRLPEGEKPLLQRYERMATFQKLRDAHLRKALEEVLVALGSVGILPVALKGPVLADRIYENPALRGAGDLDLLIAEAELARGAAALAAKGFHRGPPLVEAYQRRHHHHLQLHRAGGPRVELHFRALSSFGALVPTDLLLSRARSHRTPLGTPLLVLAPEDEIIVLSVHAVSHQLARAAWLFDLLLFLERHKALDWAEVSRRAIAYRCSRPLAYALARALALGVPVPARIVSPLGRRRRAVCDSLSAAALLSKGGRATALRMLFDLALRDRPLGAPAVLLREAAWFLRRRARLPASRFGRLPPRASFPAMAQDGRAMVPFWQPVRGESMRPTLRDRDEVLLAPASEVKVGDVVVVRLPGKPGAVLHRIIELSDSLVVTRGDACSALDPPVPRAGVLFRALARWRAGVESPIPKLEASPPLPRSDAEVGR